MEDNRRKLGNTSASSSKTTDKTIEILMETVSSMSDRLCKLDLTISKLIKTKINDAGYSI